MKKKQIKKYERGTDGLKDKRSYPVKLREDVGEKAEQKLYMGPLNHIEKLAKQVIPGLTDNTWVGEDSMTPEQLDNMLIARKNAFNKGSKTGAFSYNEYPGGNRIHPPKPNSLLTTVDRNLNDPSYQNQSRGGSFGSDIGKKGVKYITDTYDKNKKEIGLKVRDAYTLVRKAADYFLPHKDDPNEKKSHEAIDVDKSLEKVKSENIKRKNDIALSRNPKYGDIIYKLKEPLKSEKMYDKKTKKYESGVNQVAKSTNAMNVERRLHQQNGTWGALSSIPLVGGVMSNSLNYLQGKGKSEYARNEEIANMKMDRLSGQAQQMQEGFRTQGMRNSITNSQFGNQDMNDLYGNMNNKAKNGKSGMKDKALIEVEKDELIFRPNGKGYKLVADMVGGKSHEQGGEPIVAKEGDVIFPGKQRKQVASLLSPDGSVADLRTFEALRSRLPKDKPTDVQKGQMQAKATGGRIDGTGMDVREAFRKGCYAKKYEDGTAGVETDIKKLKSQLLVHKANGNTYEANKITKQIQILESKLVANQRGTSSNLLTGPEPLKQLNAPKEKVKRAIPAPLEKLESSGKVFYQGERPLKQLEKPAIRLPSGEQRSAERTKLESRARREAEFNRKADLNLANQRTVKSSMTTNKVEPRINFKDASVLEEAKRKELAQTKLNSQAKREADYTLKQKIEAENKARIKASASSMMEGTPKTKTMRDVIASKVVPKLQEDDALRAKRANPTIQPGKYEVSDVATRARNLKEIESTVEEYRSKLRDPKTSVAERKAINEVLKGLEEDMKKYNPLTSDELKELELKKQALASNRGKTTGSLKENVKRELILNQRSKTVEEALEAMKKPYTPPSGTPISSPRVSPSILSKVKSALPSGKNLGKAGIVAGIAGLGYGLYNTLTSDDTPIEKVKKSGKLVGEALTSAAIPGDSGVVDVKLDILNKKKQSLEKDTLLYKNDPKALSQLRTELDTVNKKIKALGGDTSSTIQHSRRTQSVIDSLETTPSDTSRTKQKPANRQLSNYVPDSTGSDALEEQYRKEDEQVSRSSSPSSYSPPPRYSELHTKGVKRGGVQLEPTDAEVKANRVENTHMRDDKGNTPLSMAEYKRNKVKELRDKKVDLSDYESPTGDDLETFYNVYHDKKHSPETKKKIANDKLIEDDRRATELWKQISTEGAKPSVTKPKPMEVDENSKPPKIYQDEELPEWNPKKRIPEGKQYDPRKDKPDVINNLPDKVEMKPGETIQDYFERRTRENRNNAKKLKNGTKSLKEYSKGTSSVKHGMEHERKEMRNFNGIEREIDSLEAMHKGMTANSYHDIGHEKKEVKNFSDVQKKLNILKRMHKGIPKAEQGMQSVFGVNTGVSQQAPPNQTPPNSTAIGPNMYAVAGVGRNAQGSLQSTAQAPVNKRPMTPMQGIAPMPVNVGNNANLWAHTSRPLYNDPNARLQGMTQRDTTITPTMPTLDEPKGSNVAKGILGQFKQKGFKGFGIKNWDSGGFNLAVGQSRARGDRYTDKYTATAGGANTNQYKKGSKKLVVKKYAWGTGFVEANRAEESRKKKEEDKQYKYLNSDMTGFTKSMELSDKIIDRNLKLREKGEKKYEKGSYYLKTRSRVGKGSNKYNSTHVEQALANEGKNLNEDEKNYIRKFYKDRNYDVPQDPARLIDMYRYAGSNFKGGFDEYKSEFLKQKGHTLPYKTREEYVEDYVDNYGDKNYALHSSNRKDSHKQFSPRDWNNSDVDNLGWELGTIINNTTTNYQPAGPASSATGPAVSSQHVVPVKETVNTESVKDRPIPTTVKDPTHISLGSRNATQPIDTSGDDFGGNGGGNVTSDRRAGRNRTTTAGNNKDKFKGGGGDSMEIDGGSRNSSAPIRTGGDNFGGNAGVTPVVHKDGSVTFKPIKGGNVNVKRGVTGNTSTAAGNDKRKFKLGPGGPQDPNTMSPAQLRGANAGVDQAMLEANARAREAEEAARQANAAGLTKLGTIEEEYAKLQGKEKEDYDKFYTEEEARRKSQYDTDKEELRNKLKAGANYNDAQFEANHPKYEPMTKGAFMGGQLTGVDPTKQALNSAQVGNTAPLTGIAGSAATWQSPAELKRAMQAGSNNGAGQGNSYIGGVPPGGGGGQGNSYITPEEKENNVNQASNPIAIGGNNGNFDDSSKYKSGKLVMRGKWTPEKAEVMKAAIQANADNYQANQTMKKDRDLSRRETAEARYKRDSSVVESSKQGPVVQGGSNVTIGNNNNNTTEEEEFRRGSRRLVVRKYEAGTTAVDPPKKKVNRINQFLGGIGIGGKNDNGRDRSKYKGLKTVIDTRKADRQEYKLEKQRLKNEKEPKEAKPQGMDFKTPRWKETREKYDPAVSADDVIANKTKLYRNNYQDLSAGKRQDVHSLMSGGGFDSGNQIANKVNKEQALNNINTQEAQRLDQVNQSNTAILNQEKMTNFGAMNEALNAQAQNKGVADSMNYSALLRNNQRSNDKEMKDMNLNMGRMQYAMAGPMMAMQMENQRLANEYMKNGYKTPDPNASLNPVNPPGSSTPSTPGLGWNANPTNSPVQQANSSNALGMGPNPAPSNPAPTINGSNFLQQTGFVVPRKGTRKLRVKRDSNISKVPLR